MEINFSIYFMFIILNLRFGFLQNLHILYISINIYVAIRVVRTVQMLISAVVTLTTNTFWDSITYQIAQMPRKISNIHNFMGVFDTCNIGSDRFEQFNFSKCHNFDIVRKIWFDDEFHCKEFRYEPSIISQRDTIFIGSFDCQQQKNPPFSLFISIYIDNSSTSHVHKS